jgi:hypothetical protein
MTGERVCDEQVLGLSAKVGPRDLTQDDILYRYLPCADALATAIEGLGEVENTADGLAAIEQFIYVDRARSWADLASALEANYQGV